MKHKKKKLFVLKILGPQKRTPKSKKNIRKNAWKQKVEKRANHALFLAKYVLTTKENSQTETLENV